MKKIFALSILSLILLTGCFAREEIIPTRDKVTDTTVDTEVETEVEIEVEEEEEIVEEEEEEEEEVVAFVPQTYTNGKHGITISFPERWYYNFEDNDRMCVSPFSRGQIATADDCNNALINLEFYDSMKDLKDHKKLIDIKPGTILLEKEVNGRGVLLILDDADFESTAEQMIDLLTKLEEQST